MGLSAHEQGDQKTISGGVPWELPPFLLFKTGSLTGWELTKQAQLPA